MLDDALGRLVKVGGKGWGDFEVKVSVCVVEGGGGVWGVGEVLTLD